MSGDRRHELRREEDELLSYRVQDLEKRVEVFAPIATTVAVQGHQLDEHQRRISAAEQAGEELLACVNSVKLKLEGIQVRLGLLVGGAALLGGALTSLVVGLVTK